MLIDAAYPARNHMQVINQYRVPAPNGKVLNRYDVTILINGLPLVHIELKKRNVSIREAFNQIERYQNEGFQQDQHRLFEYAQIFVISNGFETKYYSNTVRLQHITENQGTRRQVAAANGAILRIHHVVDRRREQSDFGPHRLRRHIFGQAHDPRHPYALLRAQHPR